MESILRGKCTNLPEHARTTDNPKTVGRPMLLAYVSSSLVRPMCVCKGLSDFVEYRFVCRVKVTEARSEGCKLKFSFANLKDRGCSF